MAKVARLGCPITSGARAVRERFCWFFGGELVDDTTYLAGVITVAEKSVPPNTSVQLLVQSIGDDGQTAEAEAELVVGPAPASPPDMPPVDPPSPPDPALAPEPPQLGGLSVIDWRDE